MKCIFLTPVLYYVTTVFTEVYLLCFVEPDSLRELSKPTSRAEICRPNYLNLKVAKRDHIGSSLPSATSELTNSHRKKSHKKT